MAIDFFVMPLSRYIAGDFVTPAMEAAWAHGKRYFIVGPEGRTEYPEGVPLGGPSAGERRGAIMEMLLGDLRNLPPPIPAHLWDETSAAPPRFHRVDPRSYECLLEEAATPQAGLFGLVKKRPLRHLTAMLFLPCAFDPPFEMSTPFERLTGSSPAALEELASRRWSAGAASAVETLRGALSDSARLCLPMIVDI